MGEWSARPTAWDARGSRPVRLIPGIVKRMNGLG